VFGGLFAIGPIAAGIFSEADPSRKTQVERVVFNTLGRIASPAAE
jgi:hypothetical protein